MDMQITCPACKRVRAMRYDYMAESCTYKCECASVVKIHFHNNTGYAVELDKSHLALIRNS